MIINHEYKFIFVRTRKTASTSLEIGLSKFCGPRDVLTRLNPKDEAIRSELGYPGRQNELVPIWTYNWDDCRHLLSGRGFRRFFNHAPATFIRDHISRSIWDSYFKFCFVRNPYDRILSEYYYYTGRTGKSMSLAEFLETSHQRKLSNFPIYSSGDEVIVDYAARYENLTEELETIADRLKLDQAIELPRAKSGFRENTEPIDRVFDEESRLRIAKECHREIALFGYSLDDLVKAPV